MRKFIYSFLLLLLFFCSGCDPVDPVIASLPQYETKVMYTEGYFQDYTDFGIYSYCEADTASVKANTYFTEVAEQREHLLSYIDNFESWVEIFSANGKESELAQNYSFDKTILDETDLYYLDSEYLGFDNYDLYVYDIQTATLFYFHNNI